MKRFNLKVKEKIDNFFDWVKGAELIELKTCDIKEDPVNQNLMLNLELNMDVKSTVLNIKKKFVQ